MNGSLWSALLPDTNTDTNEYSEVPQSGQIFIFEGGGGGTPDQLKSTVHRAGTGEGGGIQTNSNPKCQFLTKFSFSGGGEKLQTNIPEILEWGHSGNFEPKILVTGMW